MATVLKTTSSQPVKINSPLPYPDLNVHPNASIKTHIVPAIYFLISRLPLQDMKVVSVPVPAY